MSQRKTVMPGVEPEDNYNAMRGQASFNNSQSYARPSNANRRNGTIFTGIDDSNVSSSRQSQNSVSSQSNGKPVVGFLYSVSRTGLGEYWPLHIGQNVIGNDPECDIVLGEGTVSRRHVGLHINKMKKPEKIEATIVDLGSSNGTQVNENSVSVARPVECFNGDIITVGDNYNLLLILIDTKALGLQLSNNFIDCSSEIDDYIPAENHNHVRPTVREDDDRPIFVNPTDHDFQEGYPTEGTVGMDSTRGPRRGGTEAMN